MQRDDVWRWCFLSLLGVLHVISGFTYRGSGEENKGKVEKNESEWKIIVEESKFGLYFVIMSHDIPEFTKRFHSNRLT